MSNSDWEKLTKQQQEDLDAFRNCIGQHLIHESGVFYKQHPELRLTWNCTSDAIIRGGENDHAPVPL